MRRALLLAGLAAFAAGIALLGPGGGVLAQGPVDSSDLMLREECAQNPSSEACICDDARGFVFYPAYSTLLPSGEVIAYYDRRPLRADLPPATYDDLAIAPESGSRWIARDSLTGVWDAEDRERDLIFVQDVNYEATCSFDYYRENLRRLWVIALAVGGALIVGSGAWAGVMHMQDSVSGEGRATSRTVLVRTVIGLIILGGVFLVWEAFAGSVFDASTLYDGRPPVVDEFTRVR